MQAGRAVSRYPSLALEPCAYPDARPPAGRWPYLYRAGRAYPLDPSDSPAAIDTWLADKHCPGLAGRIAVLAVGSNAYPRQLADKLAGHEELGAQGVVTLRIVVPDVAVAYCGGLSRRHGYTPVSLTAAAGERCETWVQWLTPAQLERISQTEGARYRLAAGPAPSAGTPSGRVLGWWYDTVLDLGAGIVRLAGHDQAAVLAAARNGLGRPGAWLCCAPPEALRDEADAWLRAHAAPNPLPNGWAPIARDRAGWAAAVRRKSP